MKNGVQILNEETLSDRKFPLKFYNYRLTKDGETTDKKAEVYFRPDAVAVLLYDEQRQTFLLTRQFRFPAYLNGAGDGYIIEVCAGLIDDGETPEATACREVEEELGYEIKTVESAGMAYTSVGGITEKIHLFTAAYNPDMKKSEGGGLEAEGEAVELIEMTMDEARQKLKNVEFTDLKTLMLLQHYFLK